MNVCKCDRCGAYVDKNDIPIIHGYLNPENTKFSGESSYKDIRMQLCYECYDKLLRFLKRDEKESCIDCEFFSDSEYYADNTISVSAVAFGSCTKCQRNIISTSPNREVPSWCPLKGDKE